MWLYYKPVSETNDVRIYDQQQFIMYAHFADEAYQKLITLITLTHLEEKKESYTIHGF